MRARLQPSCSYFHDDGGGVHGHAHHGYDLHDCGHACGHVYGSHGRQIPYP